MSQAKAATPTSTPSKKRQSAFAAARQTLPIVLGYVTVGFAYGVLAQKVGISFVNTILMSVIVYAGSAQLIAVGLIGSSLAPVSIIATTFIVNLRHLLMSAALSPGLKSWSKLEIAAFTAQITDESFALHSQRFAEAKPNTPARKRDCFVVNVIAHCGWIAGSWLGFSAGTLILDVRPLSLDFALPAMFIALLVGQVKNWLHILIAVLSGSIAVTLLLLGVDQWNVIIATVATALLGAFLQGNKGTQ